MQKKDVLNAWGRILQGHAPSLSIEITRQCPLRCPGCYAYEPEHLHELGPLRDLADYKGKELVDNILKLVDLHRPLHLSIVGGEPLVRHRELNDLLPKLSERGVVVQLVTSAVREIPKAWNKINQLHFVVSIDGLQPDHDVRRAPATYERILKNIKDQTIIVHCTITNQMAGKYNYFDDFLTFWSNQPEVRKIWFSLFTPQVGDTCEEILPQATRTTVLNELAGLRSKFPKLDLPDIMLKGYHTPPSSPEECIFAKTTLNYTADLKSKITPCQFGGNPDCSQCGCVASAGLKGIGDYRLFNLVSLRTMFKASSKVGQINQKFFPSPELAVSK